MNIRQVRKKIRSVSNVKKITKAMQLVSAIKMRRAQQKAIESKPYRENLAKIIYKLIANIDIESSRLMMDNIEAKKENLVIVISSNKGLCGAFNFNLFKFIFKNINFSQSDFISVGKKAAVFLARMGVTVSFDFSSNNPLENVSAIYQTALSAFLENKYAKVILIYNKFINTLKSEPVAEVILPVSLQTAVQITISKGEYLIEPSTKTIINSLLSSFVEEEIRGAIIESEASEHSARMVAMKNATESAEDVIYNLTFLRNKLRQEKITYELLDMVTAKESVEMTW